MKLTNLVDNMNRQTLSIMSSVWNWLNGLLIGLIIGLIGTSGAIMWYLDDEFGIGIAHKNRKKK